MQVRLGGGKGKERGVRVLGGPLQGNLRRWVRKGSLGRQERNGIHLKGLDKGARLFNGGSDGGRDGEGPHIRVDPAVIKASDEE